jgi:ribonuclease BN (tRNA processing enzyme)
MFAVTILGNNSAVPAFDRHPTSQVVTLNGRNYLVDCGEGTQIQLINYRSGDPRSGIFSFRIYTVTIILG